MAAERAGAIYSPHAMREDCAGWVANDAPAESDTNG